MTGYNSTKLPRVTLIQLVAATCFMVSGGPYGLEDLVLHSGYSLAILILVITPIIWSIPTALMVGELASAIPAEGGYYVWVRRALGPFWGFEAAWLSLVASIFDMAIYPTLFVAYLSQLFPILQFGYRGIAVGLAVIAVCALLNLRGAVTVGRFSLITGLLLLAPFAAIVFMAVLNPPAQMPATANTQLNNSTLLMGILVSMWNYMGWDNASTIAQEVENPKRTYPVALGLSVIIVAAIYVVSVAAAWHAHISPEIFNTGGWASVGQLLGGKWLQIAVIVGGCLAAFGTFNSLVMSYSRLPYALAKDKLLPGVFLKKFQRTDAPWFSVLVCSAGWALSLGLGFERLVQLNVLFYGASLLLEFIALVVLRVKEPELERPFKIPGGLFGTTLLGLPPLALISLSLVRGNQEQVLGMNMLVFGLLSGFLGAVIYCLFAKGNAGLSNFEHLK